MNNSKNNLKILSVLFLSFFFLSLGLLVFGDYTIAAEMKVDNACAKFKYPWCDKANTFQTPASLIKNFYLIGLGLAGAMAFGVAIYGAILYTVSAGNTSMQSEARKWMEGAAWGVGLLLGAYLILYTINPNLVEIGKTQNFLDTLIKRVDVEYKEDPQAQLNKSYVLPPSTVLDGKDGKAYLEGISEYIKVKQGVDLNVQKSTLDEVAFLSREFERYQNDKYGGIRTFTTVTAGKDGPHETSSIGEDHASGKKVDLRYNALLYQFIKDKGASHFEYIGTWSDGSPVYKSPTNSYYAMEPEKRDKNGNLQPAHLDVCAKCSPPQGLIKS